MSKRYRTKRNNTINILILAFLIIGIAPVIFITVLFLIITYILEIRGKNIIYIAMGLMILTLIIKFEAITHFLLAVKQVLLLNISAILQHNFFSLITAYSRYNLFDWLIVINVSLLLTGYFLIRIEKQIEKENVGVKKIDTEIKDINSNTVSSIKNKSGTYIGKNNNKKSIYLQDDVKHVFIAGTTGAGKTVLLSNFIKRAAEQNYGNLIVDGKGDNGKDSILQITKDICSKNNKKLFIIDMNSPETSDKYNPFLNGNETVIKDMLVNMSDWSEEHYKINVERYMQRLVKLLYLTNESLSFEKIIHYVSWDNFQALSTKLVKENKISKEEHLKNIELISTNKKIIQDAVARFATIAESKLGKIFHENGIDITTAIQEKAVILFVLNPLLYPETSKVFGKLILIDSKKAVSNLFNTTDRKFFIFDEINVYASSVLLDLINKSRSAKVTCFCASQSLADLESAVGESFKHQIIENCNNYFIMRQNSFKSAEECAKLIGTTEKMKMTYQLSDTESTGKGSARKTREFIFHPDQIKTQKQGECIFVSRDNGICERIKVYKPF